jgi:hypothetical protein
MIAMAMDDSGISNFYHYNPEADTTTQWIFQNISIAEGLIK